MSDDIRADISSIDWDQVRFKRAASGVVAILFGFAFISVVGTVALTATVATLFNIASAGDGPMSKRWKAMLVFTAVGALVGGLSFWAVGSVVATAIVIGGATYLGTVAAGFGEHEARAGLFLTLWAIVAMSIGSADIQAVQVAEAFVIGGAIALIITGIRLSIHAADEAESSAATVSEGTPFDLAKGSTFWERVGMAVSGPIGIFAIFRAVAVVIAALIGFWLVGEHFTWAAMAVIIIVRPSTSQTASVAVQRTLGTALGALIAVLAVQFFPDSTVYALVGFIGSAFFMVAFLNANYTLFAVFLTSTLVFSVRLVTPSDASNAGVGRVVATLVGAVVALLAVFIADRYLSRRRGLTA